MNMVRKFGPKTGRALAVFVAMLACGQSRGEISSDWTGGTGNWDESARWKGGLPARPSQVHIGGTEQTPAVVTLDHGDALMSHLGVAEGGGSRASFTLNGASLTVIGTVDIGKYNASNGRIVVNSGKVFTGTFFFSGGGGIEQAGTGVLEVRGGTIVTKDFELGKSSGCTSIMHVVGSKASAIVAEDGLHTGVYNYLSVEKQPKPSTAELIFDVDAEGVTPIFTWGKTEGRVYFPVPDGKGNGLGTCKLLVNLLAPPPSGDLLLIGSSNPSSGTFTDLAEGASVAASFGGKDYEWSLTYHGGANKCGIMLTNPRVRAADGTVSRYITGGPSKKFSFDRSIVEAAYRQLYRQVDAQQSPVGGKVLAFPGAQGYGAYTSGGRGGKILYVTNLKDAGPGSLRAALETKGPRTVIFRVSGLIETKGLVVQEPYLTIAGQTAPGDGICIKKTDGNAGALMLDGTHDIIIRFLRVRAGDNTGEFRGESFRADNSDNFIIDHCSCSWGNPETLSASGTVDRYTVQWCVISEGNNQQRHAFASIIGGDRSTWHHNLFAQVESRVPRWGDITVQCDFRNNVLYDWGGYCGYGDLRTLNYVNNYLRAGSDSTQKNFIFDPKTLLPSSIYVSGNFMAGRQDVIRDNWKGVSADRSLQSSTPFAAPAIQLQSAEEAFSSVLKNAGAVLPKRDSVDARAVANAQNGTGKIINNENDVGGWPVYSSGEPPKDSANDGIPDDWKRARGLPLDDGQAAGQVTPSGYTQVELYLNSLVPDDVMK
jgi:pectate lyase